MSDQQTRPTAATRSAGTGQTVRSVLLWVLVGAGLLYGVVETATQAAALFGA